MAMASSFIDLTQGIPRECITCDGPTCENRAPTKRCSRCRTEYYCSIKCQRARWDEHRPYCVPLEQMIQASDDSVPLDPSIFEKSTVGSDQDHECPICYSQPMDQPVQLKSCRHSFCTRCLVEWQKKARFQSNTVGASPCPLCRQDAENIETTLLEQSHMLASEANMRKSLDEAQRTELREKAIECTDKLLSAPNAHYQAYATKAEILIELGRGKDALDCLDEMIAENKRNMDHPMIKMIQQKEEAEARGDYDESQRLEDACVQLYESEGTIPMRLNLKQKFHLYLSKSKAFQTMEDWENAARCYSSAMMTINEPDEVSPIEMRKAFMGMARCAYMVGEYERSIAASNMALEMNRHFDEVHKYKALSFRALGQLDEAIETMNRAVLYETPWKPENIKVALKLYHELIEERAAKE